MHSHEREGNKSIILDEYDVCTDGHVNSFEIVRIWNRAAPLAFPVSKRGARNGSKMPAKQPRSDQIRLVEHKVEGEMTARIGA